MAIDLDMDQKVKKTIGKGKEKEAAGKKKEENDENEEAKDEDEEMEEETETEAGDKKAEDSKGNEKKEIEIRPPKEAKPSGQFRKALRRGTHTSQSLYEIGSTPQEPKHTARTETDTTEVRSQLDALSEQHSAMQKKIAELQQQQSPEMGSVVKQMADMQEALERLTVSSKNQSSRIDVVDAKVNMVHDVVLDAELEKSRMKMTVKQFPDSATPRDKRRVCAWLLWEAGVDEATVAYDFKRSGMAIITFASIYDRDGFKEKMFSEYSAKHPLYYWDENDRTVPHPKGGSHRLIVTLFLNELEQKMLLPLQTAISIMTDIPGCRYSGCNTLSLRTSDRQIYDTENRRMVAKAAYNKDTSELSIIVEADLVDHLDANWEEQWAVVHKDHRKYREYARYPYDCTFSRLREDDEFQKRSQNNKGKGKGFSKGKNGQGWGRD